MARRKTHPGSIEMLPSGNFRLRICVAGKLHRETLKDITREDAEDYARTKHQELVSEAKRLRAGLPGRISFSAMLDRFEKSELPV